MRKSILAIGALAVVALASCGGGSGTIVNKWAVVQDKSAFDSMYNAQMESIDTLTALPPDFLMMQAEFAKMSPDSAAKQVPPEMAEMLRVTDLASFKTKLKETLVKGKAEQDSLDASRAVIYEFSKEGLLKMYASDDLANVDTSMKYIADVKGKNVKLMANPSVVEAAAQKDTITFDILHISKDSLSLKLNAGEAQANNPNAKPMAFKVYQEKKAAK